MAMIAPIAIAVSTWKVRFLWMGFAMSEGYREEMPDYTELVA